MLHVNAEEYQKMNANQDKTISYSTRILAKINKRKRKETIEKNKRIELGKDKR